ncbi:MAG: hypothetical protein JST12_11155 [Armatimonadetes bacterium]|nr:hypothetical protein [Armatimonadota bacterium]MBS1702210.1 hypothetical protein [Armatimonadota bacterium]MBS1727042.1 hypothetical protein [Armatimonadota bacterium]
MKIKVLVAMIAMAAPFAAFASAPTQGSADVDKILYKIQQLNLIKFIQPILLKKSQYNDLLTVIERCRAKENDIKDLDAKELKKVEGDIDTALSGATNDGKYPSRELQEKLIKVQDALVTRRRIATNEMVDMIYEVCKKTLNEGQMNVIKNLIDPSFVGGKTDKMTDEQKIRLFIQQIFLDHMAYDLMREMAKHAE